jgi:hypothetical protein
LSLRTEKEVSLVVVVMLLLILLDSAAAADLSVGAARSQLCRGLGGSRLTPYNL